MLIYRRTSLMESNAQTLVNTVNCVGVMGKGVALEFKKREPKMFAAYKRICGRNLLEPGKLWLWHGTQSWVLNFPTKEHWRNPSKIEWIELGLDKFVQKHAEMDIREVSFPRLGCGNGGLDWDEVRPIMENYLKCLKIPIYIHDYSVDIGLPEHLEAVAQQVSADYAGDLTFDSFTSSVMAVARVAGHELADFSTRKHFKASQNGDTLVLTTGESSFILDQEDLWGVWIGLQGGLLTQEKAGWSNVGAGRPLMSLLGLLPQMRAIEVQKAGEELPELAIEIKPGRNKSVLVPVSSSH